MKKIMIIVMMIFALAFLASCSSNGDTAEPQITQNPTTQYENNPTVAVGEQKPELSHQWTIEELGATITAAGEFWNDWWWLRGAFSLEHIGDTPWDYWVEQPDHPRSRGFSMLLPSSGFETITDIALHLQHFYTDEWINRELFNERRFYVEIDGIYYDIFGSPTAFEEYDGVLYVATARYGAVRPDWTTVTHTLIEQDGSRTVVETTATAYDHRGSGYEMPTVTYRFVFYEDRIESGLGTWRWPDAGDLGASDTAAGQGFYTPFGDYLFFAYRTKDVVLESFDALVYIPHPALEGVDIRGEDVLIGASRTIYNISLILIENIWDDAANQDGFTVTESFLIAEALQPGEAIIISGYVGLGSLPWSGITFTIAPGERHFFAINHDNSDSPNWFVLLDITGQMLAG